MGEKNSKSPSQSSISAESLQQRLDHLGAVRIKKMFGGHGVFADDKMFALIDSNGIVFFKVDETNLSRYEEVGSIKHSRMPYYQIPEEILNNDAVLEEWAQISIDIAKKAK